MVKAKKSLGQNFLIDKNIIEKITSTVDINNKNILEIGPGTGNLTSFLLKKKPKKFYVIEKDEDLLQNLTSRYQMALKDKLHALRDLEYSKTRGDDEAMANEKEDIEVDSKKMKLFKVEISDAKKHLEKNGVFSPCVS